MKITQEIWDDWSGPMGYNDLNGATTYCRNEIIPCNGGLAIVHYKHDTIYGYSVEAENGGWKGSLSLVPKWIKTKDDDIGFIACLLEKNNNKMPDPEFSLDEISLAQELIQRG